MQYWHVTLSSIGRISLFPRRVDRVEVAVALARYDARVLLSCAVDDHLHVVVEGERPTRLGGNLLRLLARRQEVQPAHYRPVESRRHLVTLVDYVLRQPAKHDLGVHPALWEGSCFPDLVGARRIGFDPTPLERALPRLHHRDILTPVGLRRAPTPLAWEALPGLGVDALARAVAASCGLDSLVGARTAARVAGRRALVHLAAGLPTPRVAAHLDHSPRGVRKLRSQPADAELLTAARTWLALEAACRNQVEIR